MKIVHVASEFYPYVKTGGLADAAGSLGGMLADMGHQVVAFLPGYRAVFDHPAAANAERCLRLRIAMGDEYLSGEVRRFSPRANLTIYLICRDECFDRAGLYGNGERDYEDNFHRFLFFQKGVVEALRLLDLGADIVHGHDWQAGLLPLLLRDAERHFHTKLAAATAFTIHNIAFRGLFPLRLYHYTNLPMEFIGIDGVEFYGQLCMLKAGILFADRVTTVSPNYAREIQTPKFGCGLEGVVAARAGDLAGLLNGIDVSVWSPSSDVFIPAHYSASDLGGKTACRVALLKSLGWDGDFSGPVFGVVCRFTEQKGVDLILANKDFFLGCDCRLVVLGAGEKRFEDAFRALVMEAHGKVTLTARLDEPMSHLIEAGSDFFLMPSFFEPCGLNQMYSQAYGTVPIVSRVGGLVDTVSDADDLPHSGTGLMCTPNAASLRDALERALRLYADKPRYAAVQQRGMARDFCWKTAAARYEALYGEMS